MLKNHFGRFFFLVKIGIAEVAKITARSVQGVYSEIAVVAVGLG